jgi:hypothetical protein
MLGIGFTTALMVVVLTQVETVVNVNVYGTVIGLVVVLTKASLMKFPVLPGLLIPGIAPLVQTTFVPATLVVAEKF